MQIASGKAIYSCEYFENYCRCFSADIQYFIVSHHTIAHPEKCFSIIKQSKNGFLEEWRKVSFLSRKLWILLEIFK